MLLTFLALNKDHADSSVSLFLFYFYVFHFFYPFTEFWKYDRNGILMIARKISIMVFLKQSIKTRVPLLLLQTGVLVENRYQKNEIVSFSLLIGDRIACFSPATLNNFSFAVKLKFNDKNILSHVNSNLFKIE